ncbi:hypothetical protein GCM10009839_72280 [Catenulispora yoronensis]|uniref:Bacterial toxin 44 domain-containing protein n=1 Tax=Catenulispora yoronensis TaxID=450799 RepID=A0ABN2V9E5_9ACTN
MRPDEGGGGARPTTWWILGFGSDPVPGDTFAPALVSSNFTQVADNAETVHRDLFALLSDPALTNWLGKSGEAFYRAFEPFPQQLGSMKNSYHDAAGALDKYQTTYAECQGDADGACGGAQRALSDVGLTPEDLHGLPGDGGQGGDQGYVDALSKILIARQKPDPAPDPSIPHPAPGPAPGYVPLNNNAAISQASQTVINTCVNARKKVQSAVQRLTSAANTCAKALHDAADEAITHAPWSGTTAGAYGGGTFDQRFKEFGGDPADLKLDPAVGADFTKDPGDDPAVSPRYNASRDFIFQEIFSMMNSDQFKNIQELLREGEHPSPFDTDPGGKINAAITMWAAMVGPGQPWDFKGKIQDILSKIPTQPGETHQYTRFDEDPQVELYDNIWANISYGYVGRAAGFSADDLQHGAELNAYLGGGGKNTQGNYVGRQMGIDLFEHYRPDQLTKQAIDDEIYAHLDQLRPYSEYQGYPSKLDQPPKDWKGGDLPNNPLY